MNLISQHTNSYRLAFRLASGNHFYTYDFRAETPEELQPIVDFFTSRKYIRGQVLAGDTVYDKDTIDALKELYKKIRGRRDSNVTSKYKGNHLRDFYQTLKEGDLYMVMHERIDLNCTIHNAFLYRSLLYRRSFQAEDNSYTAHLGRLLIAYTGHVYGVSETHYVEGERDLTRRRCRFCGRMLPDVTFEHESHAIPEAVGNTRLFCLEECDQCNNELAPVEEHFIRFMDFRRATSYIAKKGSSAPPDIKGMNFGVKDGKVYVDGSKVDQEFREQGKIKLMHSMMITDQGLYRSLCKFVMDLIPSPELSHFQQTIAWVKGLKDVVRLPSIYHTYGIPEVRQPQMWLFLNHRDVDYSPYCTALLHVCDAAFMFMVPFTDRDGDRFGDDNALEQHWTLFQQCIPMAWEAWDLSSKETKFPHVFLDLKDAKMEGVRRGDESPDIRSFLAAAPVFPRDGIRYSSGGVAFDRADVSPNACLVAPQIEMNPAVKTISERDINNIAVDYDVLNLSANRSSGQCRMDFEFVIRNSASGAFYMKVAFGCLFQVEHLSDYLEFRDRGPYVNKAFMEYIWTSSLQIAETLCAPLRHGTPFEPFDLTAITLDRCATAVMFTER